MLLGATALLFALVMLTVPVIHQPASYHNFADKRMLGAGIPKTLDVLSNIAFLIAGVAGLLIIRKHSVASATFVLGTFATCAASTYYHLQPNDSRLVYDRLGMVLCLAAIVCFLVGKERSLLLVIALIAGGAASVFWWRFTNDLRPWGFVQFFPMLLLLAKRDRTLIVAAGLYGLAKACEIFDRSIFAAFQVVSGHTLKHLIAGAATMLIVWWIASRRD